MMTTPAYDDYDALFGTPDNDNHTLTIATGNKNRGTVHNETITWQELCRRLSTPLIDRKHSRAAYFALSGDEQGNLKAAPGLYVGGACDGTRTGKGIVSRTLINLDIDRATALQLADFRSGSTNGIMQFEWLLHHTRTHRDDAPKVRIVLPLATPVSPEQYVPLARIVGSMIFGDAAASMDAIDEKSFEPQQGMFWPSVCHDAGYLSERNRGELVDAEAILAAFGDWRDHALLPYSATQRRKRLPKPGADKLDNPCDKDNIVGWYCRTAGGIHNVIANELSGIYTRSKRNPDRYTFVGGSTTNGFHVLDNGQHAISYHSTDPTAGMVVNAFDLVRLHLHGHLDKEIDVAATPTWELPSYRKMRDLVHADPRYQEYDLARITAKLHDLSDLPAVTAEPANDDAPATDAVVAKLNRRHAVVAHNGRTLVSTEDRDGSVNYGTASDLHTFYANVRRPVPDGKAAKSEPVSAYWLRHPERRTYPGGVAFTPGKTVPGALNLWRGWAVEPDASRSCEAFLDHVRNVVCRGNSDHADYVLGWLAHLIQRPEVKPGVALVLRGGKGAGKDTVAEYVAAMIGRRYVPVVSHENHIVGNFNRRLESALLLHVQEGSWAGDKKSEGVLKYLVTSDTVEIERKGVDSFSLPSYLRIFISSNADWVVPASADERRWAVFSVSDSRRGDAAYFTKLRAEMENGGPAALLAWLQAYDLSGFDVRKAPDTAGLLDQKLESLRGIEFWWFETLSRGDLPGSLIDDAGWRDGPRQVLRTDLYDNYATWSRHRKFDGQALGERQFGAKLRGLVPGLDTIRPGSGNASRVRSYVIPPLDACRGAFDARIGGAIDWT